MTETTATLVRRIATLLRDAFAGDDRTANAGLDARLIVGHALGLDSTGLVLHAARPVSAAEVAATMALARRRALGEPVARITGSKGFWTLDLVLSPETLVPRPDTETVVSAALAWARGEGRGAAPLSILDLGTGSGAILLALLSELPAARGIGLDRAEGAARTARANALRHGLGDRAGFVVSDWATAVSGRFDLVVSNPPYIPREEIAGLALDVRGFDPDMALDGGPDGLAAYRIILAAMDAFLAEDGRAFLEVGSGQAGDVSHIAESHGFAAVQHRDIAGIDRVVEVKRGKASRQKLSLEIGREPATVRWP